MILKTNPLTGSYFFTILKLTVFGGYFDETVKAKYMYNPSHKN